MPSFRTGRVVRLTSERAGLQRLVVSIEGDEQPAIALSGLTGAVDVGDDVVVNTTAVDLDLGTGGDHIVHWNLGRDSLDLPGPDHVMKLRYTSLQVDAGTAELEHPECDEPLGGIPVVACTLHSQVVPVVAGVHAVDASLRIAYLQTDGGALPLALSDTVAALGDRAALCGTVSAGHAFGGDLEAVGTASGLGLAVHTLGADVVVASIGPGVVGTGTALGTSALDAVGVVDLTDSLGGVPVLCVRVSDADPRTRHRGVSHHTRTIGRLSHAEPLVAELPGVPTDLDGVRPVVLDPEQVAAVERAAVDATHTSMGRTGREDPAPARNAVAAGVLAAGLALGCRRDRPGRDPATRVPGTP